VKEQGDAINVSGVLAWGSSSSARERMEEVSAWLAQLPSSSLPLVPVGTELLPREAVWQIEQVLLL